MKKNEKRVKIMILLVVKYIYKYNIGHLQFRHLQFR